MLYVFHGTDVPAVVSKGNALVNSLRARKPDASFVKVDADSWTGAIVEEHLGGQGLFSNKYIILLDRVTENAEADDTIADFIPAMQESPNIFIAIEGKLRAELKKAFEKHAEKVVAMEKQKAGGGKQGGKTEFNIFALADALAARDSFKAWSIYREAVDRGIEAESIIGTLFWQAKSLALARDAGSASEAGLSPFVYTKSKRYADKYSKEELGVIASKLINIYHDGHRGIVNPELATERLLLRL